ncbi:biotin-independent malonate decarboxylase subunit gamma [Rhodococcus daqingensis]|uniref:Biotin-independent malonate decarboxylase subunit gamma n=1 Tax=Rhodococcus daqingensis TaxID=2479363 RepID=A0ABW2RX95_9NOCA
MSTSTLSGRGTAWFHSLTDTSPGEGAFSSPHGAIPSVLCAGARLGERPAFFLSVVPDPGNRWPRARQGEVGLGEGWALAESVRRVLDRDRGAETKTIIVAIVDVPSQAYGYREELLGIHQALAAAVDAYSAARLAGHPVIALLVGSGISGGFLAHGLQANRILALDDDGVTVQAMSKKSAARVTRRSVEELDEIARVVPATAYDGATFATLGAVHRLLAVGDADNPTPADVASIRAALLDAVEDVIAGPSDLSPRLATPGAHRERAASREVRRLLAAEWDRQAEPS